MDWVFSYSDLNDDVHTSLIRTRGPLLAGHTYTNASFDTLRTCCDFMNLIFVIDDVCDAHDIAGVRATRNAFVDALNGTYDENSMVSRCTRE